MAGRELPTYVFPFFLLVQRYIPDLSRFSVKNLTLSTSALSYLTSATTEWLIILLSGREGLQEEEKNRELRSENKPR